MDRELIVVCEWPLGFGVGGVGMKASCWLEPVNCLQAGTVRLGYGRAKA